MDIVDSSLLGGSGWAKAKSESIGSWSNKKKYIDRKLQLQLHRRNTEADGEPQG